VEQERVIPESEAGIRTETEMVSRPQRLDATSRTDRQASVGREETRSGKGLDRSIRRFVKGPIALASEHEVSASSEEPNEG